ncbi:MAG: hypothetical protein ACPGJS_00545 [Flammeovirgaceae bacterium]
MDGINVDQIVTELGEYITQHDEIRTWCYNMDELDAYTDTLTQVKGEYPTYQSVADHVVQEFTDEWTELGETKFQVKILKAFRQKVNYPIKPHKVLGSWLAFLHRENVSLEQMPISRWIMDRELKPKVIDDINILEGQGQYVAGTRLFGDSMDGIITVLTNILASGNPFRMPLPALTSTNIVDNITLYERMLPARVLSKINRIFMSRQNLDRYKIRYRDQFGQQNDYAKAEIATTWLGNRELVGLRCLDGSDLIFSTVGNNFLKLVDIFNEPAVTDIQKLDYKIKVFMEFVLGFDFWVDELVFISDFGGTTVGLPNNHALFYPATPTTIPS